MDSPLGCLLCHCHLRYPNWSSLLWMSTEKLVVERAADYKIKILTQIHVIGFWWIFQFIVVRIDLIISNIRLIQFVNVFLLLFPLILFVWNEAAPLKLPIPKTKHNSTYCLPHQVHHACRRLAGSHHFRQHPDHYEHRCHLWNLFHFHPLSAHLHWALPLHPNPRSDRPIC